MQDTWSHLLLIFGLAAPLVPAAALQTATMNRSAPTTLLTEWSANRTAVKPLTHSDLLPNTPVDLPISTKLHIMKSANTTTSRPVTDSDLIPTARIALPISTSSATTLSANSTGAPSLTDSHLTPTTPTDLPASNTSTTSTTSGATTSANPTTTQSLGDVQSTFDPLPTTSPTLSVQTDYQAPTPTPGYIAIINGIPTQVLNDTIQQQSVPMNADVAAGPIGLIEPPNQPWNTSYPGPIHDDDWDKYLQIWDPVWWSTNLDSFRQTSCLCSHDDFLTNPEATVASYMNFEYYSHTTGAVQSLDWLCGPARSIMTQPQRVTSAKGKSEFCWQAAGGEYAGDHVTYPEIKLGYYCDAEEGLCVEPWRDGKRAFKFHGHKRNYDRDGVHTWSEIQPVVAEVCGPICKERFLMRFDDMNHHAPSFVTTFYPPKPVDLTVVGD